MKEKGVGGAVPPIRIILVFLYYISFFLQLVTIIIIYLFPFNNIINCDIVFYYNRNFS